MTEETQLNTLVLVHDHPRVLLGMKKRGFGEGKWNGFGGKVQEGESIEQAARREFQEETKADVEDLEKLGVLRFEFQNGDPTKEMHVFIARTLIGEAAESDEMRPQWFEMDQIPFKEMWEDDLYWMPLFLQGKKFKGTFGFDSDFKMVKNELQEVTEIA